MNRHVFIKATEEGEKLNLTYEQEHNCKLIYKKSDKEIEYQFYEFWDISADREYSDDYIIVPFRSAYDGLFNYTSRDIFANIIGSTSDPCPSSSWVSLLISVGINCNQCVTDGDFYDSRDHSGRTYFTDYSCGGGIVGGHVMNRFDATSVQAGFSVYLLPICHNHNSCCTDSTGRNGSGFYMMARQNGKGIRLRAYLRLSDNC